MFDWSILKILTKSLVSRFIIKCENASNSLHFMPYDILSTTTNHVHGLILECFQIFQNFVKIQIFGYGFGIEIHNSHASSFLCFEIKL